YDIVFDAMAMADIVSKSIGDATEIDRARGFEANAGGTSYLSPIASMLGAHIAAPVVTITANRSFPKGAASVKWDDDGVAPDDFTLVDRGTLIDYATSREHVATLAPWYQAHNIPPHSHGCANSGAASDIPLVHTPNLRMTPASSETSFDDLVSSVRDGIAVVGGTCRMDYRRLTGQGTGEVVYRIKNGKLGDVIVGGAYLIRAPEFWQNVAALGGPQSLRWRGIEASKGQPEQQTAHSVGAVPALVQNMLFVQDPRGAG
ncbi:MAG TPA: metallopeptidase TldD-related protein, partial [Gemmatimonadaceae bacterium]|nr:metallopeptidase TldD-related protein [Gemmatimonadaceae bacterium]